MSFEVLLHPKRVKRLITRLPRTHQKKFDVRGDVYSAR